MDFAPLEPSHNKLNGYYRPEMMAIGDSLYNGTRSMTTTRELAQISAPSLVAKGLGVADNFIKPDYPRHVLFDLEQHLRNGLDRSRLREECITNAEEWISDGPKWSNHRFFDNISIAGAEYADLWENTSGNFKSKIPHIIEKIKGNSSLDIKSIGDLYYAINAAFLLNPSGDPTLDDLTPLEQVASRQPRRLLINIGSNNGLFATGISCNISRENCDRIKQIPELAKHLGQMLELHCPEVEHIYFNSLIRPRALANLAPRTDEGPDGLYDTPQQGGYFPHYVGRLMSLNGATGEQMKALDQLVLNVNKEVKQILVDQLGPRVHFLSLYDWVGNFDRKHGTENQKIWVKQETADRRLSNYPLEVYPPLLGGGFKQGGMFSLDNMHPCTPGYSLLANFVGNSIMNAEGITYNDIDSQWAFDQDSLLKDLPQDWGFLNFIGSLLGVFVKI